MEYELHLYISLQPSDKAEFITDLPKMPPETPWWGKERY